MRAVALLRELFANFEFLWENATSQGEGSYWPFLTDEEMTLNWFDSVTRIDRTRAREMVRSSIHDGDETVRQAAAHSAGLWRDSRAG